MPTGRMNREQFYGQLAALDEQRLKKAFDRPGLRDA